MKLQFSSNQDYQLQAVRSVVDVFEGQPLAMSGFEVSFAMEGTSLAFTQKGIANNLVLSHDQLLHNVQAVQERNGIPISEKLEPCFYQLHEEDKETKQKNIIAKGEIALNFTVEMETGTGKTYTYLRTVYELNKVYGFKKFVVVVPSVAIREGTVKNLEVTHEHLQAIYNKPPINYIMYDSRNLTALRNFATSNAIQVLVINIDSFTKDSNVINTIRETGIKPIEYIQATNPIVIVDEPQNMETDTRRAAIHNLNPLCTLRYSATHRNLYNLLYNLSPVRAYDLGLVKQIEVDGITADNNYNAAFIRLKEIVPSKKNLKVKLTIYANDKGGVVQKDCTLEAGDDLHAVSGGRDMYEDGFLLTHISAQAGSIEFSNGLTIYVGESQGGLTDEVMKYQIERTVEAHFHKLKTLRPLGIKVLSLFFIDKVANYREYDTEGKPQKGKFALWFEEAFTKTAKKKDYAGLIPFELDKVHNGYFSQDKKGVFKDTKGTTKDDEDTYSLIMKEKERLLSIEEPLQFIFSHSALREGWDNPNVFQICTLNETNSSMKKRQEIGRGLRLPVDANGQRIQDKQINVLTVIANESYEEFTEALQREIQEETSVSFEGRIKDARKKEKVQRNKELSIENYPLLFEMWEKIRHKTKYCVEYSTENLIQGTVKAFKDVNRFPTAKTPMLQAQRATLNYTEEGIAGTVTDRRLKATDKVRYCIPDVYAYIQSRIDVTRSTIFQIIKQSGRYNEIEINPQMFLDNLVSAIRQTMNTLLVDGVKYTQIQTGNIERDCYSMELFESEEIETYLSDLFKVTNTEKTVFNYIPVVSDPESRFARDCDTDENVKFYFKLPRGFKIPTPIGNYIPDWAVIFENDRRIYFVAETKSTLDKQLLRDIERMKIDCGEKHFALFKPSGVEYKLAVSAKDLYQ